MLLVRYITGKTSVDLGPLMTPGEDMTGCRAWLSSLIPPRRLTSAKYMKIENPL